MPRHPISWSNEPPVSGNTKRDDPARAEVEGLKVIHRIREVDPDQPGAADLHRRQIKAMVRIIRKVALTREREARESEGEPRSPARLS